MTTPGNMNDEEANRMVQNPMPTGLPLEAERYIAALQHVARRLERELDASQAETRRLTDVTITMASDLTTRGQEVLRLQLELSDAQALAATPTTARTTVT